jgi:undecaprenyl-diphosphatase
MNFNIKLFFKINQLLGKYKWLDAFGRAGAEWAIVAMLGWYTASNLATNLPNPQAAFWPMLFLGAIWGAGMLVSNFLGLITREPRPHVTYPNSKLLFTPLVAWKSFPSDHAMSAWLIFFMALVFGLPGSEALLIMALWVSWGRVYAGVHYPFDIVGGIAVAGLMSVLAYYLLIIFF